MDAKRLIAMPSDPYDPAWVEFNKQNPRMPKAVGADVAPENAGEGEGAGQGETPETGDGGEAGNVEGKLKELEAALQAERDEKAKLLKDTMKHKGSRREAEEAAAKAREQAELLQSQLSELLGDEEITLETLQEKVAAKKAAEEEALRKAGDFEALAARIKSEHKKELDKVNGSYGAEVKKLREANESAEAEIRRLLVSNQFAASTFLKDELLLTPAKAEKLFGDHFRVEERDGRRVVVGYLGKEPLVDGDGQPYGFEDAFKAIIDADPERETLLRPKARTGAGSGTENTGGKPLPKERPRGIQAITAGLAAGGLAQKK